MARTVTSTSQSRRAALVDSAIRTFARTGYLGTPTTALAQDAGISPAYVFKLFPNKTALFVAALDRCFDLVEAALEEGASASASVKPADVLEAMGGAYARLIADRDLLLLQVHALSASDVPEIHASMTRGVARITSFAQSRSRGSDAQVQRFVAVGQLCHLLTMLGIPDLDQSWARALSRGIRHPSPAAPLTREEVEDDGPP
ncbi:TetR/AcrR family transcriptional regulator [Isoptericola sp. 178]|uniref:TetR/AcrR family transcriptional regulator n=1 Tax=Isoptericola sp. 178 TaxID=3064651 RepID=UPI002713870C|nr:TetR/AcrR family transcriptional regulator [Isoptericola sp. 178]MDO8145715.1 TetR/AcrR family transcriptional regulator [Isoptericola sp. 178]